MSLSYALTYFCDAMLYLGALGCLGLLWACEAGLFRAVLPLLAGCWLCGRLTGRGRWWLRYVPLAAILPSLLLAGNRAGALVLLPMAVYLGMYVQGNRRAPDYYDAADRFRHSLIVAGAALVLAAIIRSKTWTRGLPYLFAYFTLSMALLRLLRHDDRIARSRRFRLLNLAGVALVCAAGFALSQPGILAALRAGWLWFADRVLLNLLALVVFALQWVLYGVAWLLSKLLPDAGGIEPGEMNLLPFGSDAQPMLARAAGEVRALPPALRLALQAAGVALLAALAFMILRALSQRIARIETHTGSDVRESLDDGPAPRPGRPLLRRAPEDGVRQWYRKALALLRARGGRVAPTMNTLQIQEENASFADTEAMSALRRLYLPVRYGERKAGREDVARAREAYERMKSASKKSHTG